MSFQEMRINPHFLRFQEMRIYPEMSDLLISWSQANTGEFQEMRINPQFLKTPRKALWVELIIHDLGGKPIKSGPNFFYGFGIHIRNTFCKKIGPKLSI